MKRPDQGRSEDDVEMPRAASPRPSARINWLRRVISRAARRVKVSSRIRLAWMPWQSRSQAARATSVRVLPVPAPASTSSGPP